VTRLLTRHVRASCEKWWKDLEVVEVTFSHRFRLTVGAIPPLQHYEGLVAPDCHGVGMHPPS